VEEFMKKDKIVEVIVWNISKIDERDPIEKETDE
jgi:hypothetical protein